MARRVLPLIASVCLSMASAQAAELSGSTRTVVRVFDLVNDQDDVDLGLERVRSYAPVDQWLHLNVDRFGPRKAWSLATDMRGRFDLHGGKGVQNDFDVLIADVSWRSKHELLGLHVGRLASTVGLGWHSYDGLRLDFDRAPHVKVFTYLGLPQEWGANASPDSTAWTGALGITLVAARHGSFGMDYEIIRDGSATLSEVAGADLSFGGKAWHVDANTDYSLVLGAHGDTALAFGGTVDRRHAIEGRYTRVKPIFETGEIYNVFRVNAYDEYRVSYEFRGDKALRWGAYISHEDYFDNEFPASLDPPADPTQPVPKGPQNMDHAAATFTYASGAHSKYRGEVGWQSGWAAKRLACRFDADFELTPRWRVGGGLSAGLYENVYRLDEQDEHYALRSRAWYDHLGRWDIGVEVEDFIGESGKNVARASLIFGAKLGRARRARPWWGGRWGGAWGGGAASRHDEDGVLPAAKGDVR